MKLLGKLIDWAGGSLWKHIVVGIVITTVICLGVTVVMAPILLIGLIPSPFSHIAYLAWLILAGGTISGAIIWRTGGFPG